MVSARAWCRVDLAGGTLDIWPLGLLEPGSCTVNLAIDLAARVRLERRDRTYRVRQGETLVEALSADDLTSHPEGALVGVVASALGLPPVEAVLASDSPRGGGLGASSAMTVALIAAGETLLGRSGSSAPQRAHLARDLEARLMGLPTGAQDHYAALLGGALQIEHRPGGERVRRLAVEAERLSDSLLVVYTGQSHFSAGHNWQIVRRRIEGDPEVRALLAGIAEVAAEVPPALEAGDLPRVGKLMSREWSLRRHLSDEVSTTGIESLLTLAASLGAWGGKACGAGGGGSIALLCAPERRETIAGSLAAAGGEVLPARLATGPLEVVEGS